MDAIQLLMALFLNLSEPCNALPAQDTRIMGQEYRQLIYHCGEKGFKIWQRKCSEGEYWGRPFFLEETTSQQGIYMNQFAELQTGWHVALSETYIPSCGT